MCTKTQSRWICYGGAGVQCLLVARQGGEGVCGCWDTFVLNHWQGNPGRDGKMEMKQALEGQ